MLSRFLRQVFLQQLFRLVLQKIILYQTFKIVLWYLQNSGKISRTCAMKSSSSEQINQSRSWFCERGFVFESMHWVIAISQTVI